MPSPAEHTRRVDHTLLLFPAAQELCMTHSSSVVITRTASSNTPVTTWYIASLPLDSPTCKLHLFSSCCLALSTVTKYSITPACRCTWMYVGERETWSSRLLPSAPGSKLKLVLQSARSTLFPPSTLLAGGLLRRLDEPARNQFDRPFLHSYSGGGSSAAGRFCPADEAG